MEAWNKRALLLKECVRQGKYPTPYHTVNMTALKKKADSVLPLEHRLLTVFSSIYRTETGAWYDLLMPWL